MKLNLWPSPEVRHIHCRRGENTYRCRDVPANTSVIEYPALANSVIELVENGVVTGELEVQLNAPLKGHLNVVEARNGKNPSPRVEKKNNDKVQSLGSELRSHGETVSGKNELPVSPVDEGDARLGSGEEHRPEGSSDGLHGGNDESSVLHDRSTEGVGTVSPTVEDPGRDELQQREIRSGSGDESPSGESVQRREERGDEESGGSDSVYSWKQ